MTKKTISKEFRLKNMDRRSKPNIEEVNQNEFMSKKYKKFCEVLNCSYWMCNYSNWMFSYFCFYFFSWYLCSCYEFCSRINKLRKRKRSIIK